MPPTYLQLHLYPIGGGSLGSIKHPGANPAVLQSHPNPIQGNQIKQSRGIQSAISSLE